MKKIFKALGRSKALEILTALKEDDLKFNQITEIAENQTTAARRMDDFQEAELVSREVLQDKQRSVRYSLSEKGVKVAEFVEELDKSLE